MPPSKARLSARVLDALKPGDLCRDESVRGLFAECTASGGVSLKVQADLRVDGTRQSIRMTLGRWPALALDEARAQALAVLAEVRAGRDPRAAPAAPGDAGAWTVGRGFGKYLEDLDKRPGTDLSRRDMAARLARYLDDWRELPLASLTKEMCEARQAQVAARIRTSARQRNATGARTANAVIRDLGAVWEFASDYTALPPVNPTRRVTMIGEVRQHHEVPVAELVEWWRYVGELRNPLRVAMHRLGLLSGLRPGNLTAIELAWIDLVARRISFPASVMKNRTAFVLPLSAAMIVQVHAALDAGTVLFGRSAAAPWLFPSRNAAGDVAPMFTVREGGALKNRTGHALRHTWKTCARNARLPESTIEILLAHRLGGVRDTYGSIEDQFDGLREDQERVSAYILARAGAAL